LHLKQESGGEGMKTIGYLLKTKRDCPWSIAPDASVFDAIKLMADKGVDVLLVTEDEKLVGLISGWDFAKKSIMMNNTFAN
jgi:predicted transcriptional regulator